MAHLTKIISVAFTLVFSLLVLSIIVQSFGIKKAEKVQIVLRRVLFVLLCLLWIVLLVTVLIGGSASTFIRITLLLCAVLLYQYLLYRKTKSPHNDRRTVRTTIRIKQYFPMLIYHLFGGRTTIFQTPLEQDLSDISTFDRYIRKGESVMFPKMRTQEGQAHWDAYIKAYMAEHPLSEAEQNKKLLSSGGWKCSCKRINPSYTSTCTCGKNKRDIPQNLRPPVPKPTSWLCACGRENPHYTSTCVCGKNKRSV